MISESFKYKEKLLKNSIEIKRLINLKRYREESIINLELLVFSSAYLIRKLRDSFKVSYDVMNKSIPVKKSVLKKGEIVDVLNNHRLDEKYDLRKQKTSSLSTKDLLEYLIHSFVFKIVWSDDLRKVEGFFLNSDKCKNKIYYFDMINFCSLLLNVGTDDIQEIRYEAQNVSINEAGYTHEGRIPTVLKRGKYCEPMERYRPTSKF